MSESDVDVLIIGGGPAGLSAAVELKKRGVGRVLVVEREAAWGGIPRHCDHQGFGWFDLRRMLTGPSYARKREALFRAAKADGLLETSVLGWNSGDALSLRMTGPKGVQSVSARAVLLATGCRERPRSARLVPGDRPQGVLTTGSLQQLVLFGRRRVGETAVIVGAEHVSFSAIHTLTVSGTRVAAMITEEPVHQSFGAFRVLTAGLHGVPIYTRCRVERLVGRGRLEAVELMDLASRKVRVIACDTVVFTGNWIPMHELARLGGVALDSGTQGPTVDVDLRTTRPGVFAAGNVLHGAEMADVAALEGRVAAGSIARYLESGLWPRHDRLQIQAGLPLRWIFPQSVPREAVPNLPPRSKFVLRAAAYHEDVTLEARQGGTLLFAKRFGRFIPNRPIEMDGSWIGKADRSVDAPPIEVSGARSLTRVTSQ